MPATVTVDQLQKNARRIVARARKRPLHVMDDSGATVVMLSIEQYKEDSGIALRDLLRERMKETPKYTNEEVGTMLKERIRRRQKRA